MRGSAVSTGSLHLCTYHLGTFFLLHAAAGFLLHMFSLPQLEAVSRSLIYVLYAGRIEVCKFLALCTLAGLKWSLLAGLLTLWLPFSSSYEKMLWLLQEENALVTLPPHCHEPLSTTCYFVERKTMCSIASVHQEKGLSWHFAMPGECRLVQSVWGFLQSLSPEYQSTEILLVLFASPLILSPKASPSGDHWSSMWYCLKGLFCWMCWSVASTGIVCNSRVRFQSLINTDDKHTVRKSFLQVLL